jgi:hypothetical protein
MPIATPYVQLKIYQATVPLFTSGGNSQPDSVIYECGGSCPNPATDSDYYKRLHNHILFALNSNFNPNLEPEIHSPDEGGFLVSSIAHSNTLCALLTKQITLIAYEYIPTHVSGNVFYLFVANFQYKTQGKNKIAEQLHETIGQSVELPYFGEQDLKTVLKLEPREYLQRKKELLIDRIHNSIKIQT